MKTKVAKSFLEKSIGLMFKSKIDYGMLFIFNTENNVNFHTFFMKFPIDFLFLDGKFRVTKKISNVSPWKINITGRAKYVVELPTGESSKTELGDIISFK